MTGSTRKTPTRRRQLLVGVPASPGYAVSVVHLLQPMEAVVQPGEIPPERVAREIQILQKAIAAATRDIKALKEHVVERVGGNEAAIFDAHILMLQDPSLVDPVLESIRKDHQNARYAFHSRVRELMAQMESLGNDYARERWMDLRDISNRVLMLLGETGVAGPAHEHLDAPAVVVGHTVTPSMMFSLRQDRTLAFVTDTGGRTSHVSILARSMQIPAVAGLRDVSVRVQPGDKIIVDGTAGLVIIHPNETDLRKYRERMEGFKRLEEDLFTTRDLEPITMDRKHIALRANIELPVEADKVVHYGASGVGLFRSEFLFFRGGPPSVREQTEAYRYILRKLSPMPVTIRTLDAGGDKLVPEISTADESNPFMGWRSIRVCLDRTDIFEDQLRSLLLADECGNMRIMFPMIASLEELRVAKKIYQKVRESVAKELEGTGRSVPDPEVGIMVEVPSAVLMVEELAAEVDFFSIGTNDLVQFTLAVDRSNEKIADLFQPHHPAVLRMIRQVVQAAHRQGIPVSVCGEMVSDPLSTLLLVGLGVDELSMNPWSIMECKKFIRSITYEEARATANEVLALTETRNINQLLKKKYLQKISDLGISSFILGYDPSKQEKALLRVGDQIVGLSTLEE